MADCGCCPFCLNKLNGGTNKLYEKGSTTINQTSRSRGDTIVTVPGQVVHTACRKQYLDRHAIRSSSCGTKESGATLRSGDELFTFRSDCLYCGTPTRENQVCYPVTTKAYQDTLLKECDTRDDDWSQTVRTRIISVLDLPAADAVYHQTCSVNFRTGKCVPQSFSGEPPSKKGRPRKKSSAGRQADDDQHQAFIRVAEWFRENEDEQTTITDLVDKMAEFLSSNKDAYSEKYMRTKLVDFFGQDIIITTVNNKQNVATFRHTAENILLKFHKGHSDDPDIEKNRIIETAAKLLREDIRIIDTSHENYPETTLFESEESALKYLPESLRMLLCGIIQQPNSSVKLAAIGQAVLQAARPRVLMAPLQIALAIQMHHHFSSRFLIDSLHKLGFCSAYKDVVRFEQSAAVNQGTDIPNYDSQFIQYSGDNVDHNIRTIDGENTFHGMGIISIITPGPTLTHTVPRTQVSRNQIASVGAIQIMYYRYDNKALADLRYKDVPLVLSEDPTANLDVLWQTSLLFSPTRAAWSGLMQCVHISDHPGKSSVLFLPMIDMSSSDPSCIYSTLSYVAHHAARYNMKPIITFDQPLWWKALSIIQSQPVGSPVRKIVLRLGTFHMEMSFLGTIGHLMSGSGLGEILELLYASHAVQHMMSGKAVSRAVRAHLLMDAALNGMLIAKALAITAMDVGTTPLPPTDPADPAITMTQTDSADPAMTETSPDEAMHPLLHDMEQLYNDLLAKDKSLVDVCDDSVFTQLVGLLAEQRKTLNSSRTAKLWFQYLDMVQILKMLIKAERLGNWSLHLNAVREMLPYFAAAGHNLYAKSARIYLQSMVDLEKDHRDIHQRFKDGFHVGRRSNRSWAGLSTDLMIEQVLMRSLKTSGGLTRGRGMTEQQRVTWLLSMPACAEVNRAMQELTSVKYDTSEQSKEMMKSRQKRDLKDTQTIMMALSDKSPFHDTPKLRNIMTGIHAGEDVNVDDAKAVGETVMSEMTGQGVLSYSFKRKQQAITLATKSSIKVDGQHLQVDPQLLFQRLVIASRTLENKEEAFTYELSSYPPALFDRNQQMREPQKSVLAGALWAKVSALSSATEPSGDVQYVLDGGALLHRIPWPHGSPTYRELALLYCNYVTRNYGQACIVFDGYQEVNTKYMTQLRRSKGKQSTEVTFTDQMKCSQHKDTFLSNPTNKQRFIILLGEYLEYHNCVVLHSQGDADVLIATTGVRYAGLSTTIVVGDDTDLIMLLAYYADLQSHDIFLHTQSKSSTHKSRLWNMKVFKQHFGSEVCEQLLFIHAVSGCDTTSRLFGIGKGIAMKKCLASKSVQECSQVFNSESSTADQVTTAGEKALLVLYGGKPEDTLNTLRYKKFCEKTATKTTQLQSEVLPPTVAAARFHSLRVYLQIQQWKGCTTLSPTDWGWEMTGGHLMPVLTDRPAAPEYLLRVIHCGCNGDCSTMRCTCRKNNLDCSTACGHCHGTACSNSTIVDSDSDEESGDV